MTIVSGLSCLVICEKRFALPDFSDMLSGGQCLFPIPTEHGRLTIVDTPRDMASLVIDHYHTEPGSVVVFAS
jgi:hypothetical protein